MENQRYHFGDRIDYLIKANTTIDLNKPAPEKRLAEMMYDARIIEVNEAGANDDLSELKKRQIDSATKEIKRHRDMESADGVRVYWIKRYCEIFRCDSDYLLGYIDSPTHELKKATEITGLSEGAIAVLRDGFTLRSNEIVDENENDPRLSIPKTTLSVLLEDRSFCDLLHEISSYFQTKRRNQFIRYNDPTASFWKDFYAGKYNFGNAEDMHAVESMVLGLEGSFHISQSLLEESKLPDISRRIANCVESIGVQIEQEDISYEMAFRCPPYS